MQQLLVMILDADMRWNIEEAGTIKQVPMYHSFEMECGKLKTKVCNAKYRKQFRQPP